VILGCGVPKILTADNVEAPRKELLVSGQRKIVAQCHRKTVGPQSFVWNQEETTLTQIVPVIRHSMGFKVVTMTAKPVTRREQILPRIGLRKPQTQQANSEQKIELLRLLFVFFNFDERPAPQCLIFRMEYVQVRTFDLNADGFSPEVDFGIGI
jgi:hypothetical protein